MKVELHDVNSYTVLFLQNLNIKIHLSFCSTHLHVLIQVYI